MEYELKIYNIKIMSWNINEFKVIRICKNLDIL
jgi:hypothetical protein